MTVYGKGAGGPPSIYTAELGELICHRVATSTLGTNKLCEMYDDLPCENTIYEWRYKYKEFGENYTKAKQQQAELMAERIHDMCVVDTFIDSEGVERVDTGKVSLQRLKVDTMKWYASKLAPKIYGDKSHITADVNAHEVKIKDLD